MPISPKPTAKSGHFRRPDRTGQDGIMKHMVSLFMLYLCTATASLAADICNADLSLDNLRGNYTLGLYPGTMTIVTSKGDERVHDASLVTGTATIALYDGVPVLQSDDLVDGGVLEIPLHLVGQDEKNFNLLNDPTLPGLTPDDIALIADCGTAGELPQIAGTGTLTGPEILIPVQVQMIVMTQDENGINATGVYDSTVTPPGRGGKLILHVRISLAPE